MGIRAARDHGHDPRNAQLGALLDRPFHAVELEDRENQCEFNHLHAGNFFAQLKLNPVVSYGSDSAAPNGFAGSDIELLSDASSQHSHQMIRMLRD
jgi:hypothetical protein